MREHVPLYASAYAGFTARDQVRRATYGDDLGQSGWVTSDELDRFAEWLDLGAGSHLLDVGCGSGGPALRLAETQGASEIEKTRTATTNFVAGWSANHEINSGSRTIIE